MRNFTIPQLKAAIIELYTMDNIQAYQLCFDLLEEKIGEEAMDLFLDGQGF